MSHDVFISYSSPDKAIADAVCAFLEGRKIRCWIAPRDIPPGGVWSAALLDAIGRSRVFVLVFSGGANESPEVLRELTAAVNRGMPIIPVRVEEVEPAPGLGYYIQPIHWLDALTPPLEAHLERLVGQVAGLLRPAARPDVRQFEPVAGERASHPRAEARVPGGWKIIGGGARAEYGGGGSLLVASFPLDLQTWAAQSKDHVVVDPATVYAYAIAIADPADEWDVRAFESTSAAVAHPEVSVSVGQGYVMTGGGARAHWQHPEMGSLLTASFPADERTWTVRAKDHGYASPASITAYAIGIRPRSGPNTLKTRLFSSESEIGAHIQHSVQAGADCLLTGGGAEVHWTGYGHLLTASHPAAGGLKWAAASKDHLYSSPARLTVWAIGLER